MAGGHDPVLRIVDPRQVEITLAVPVTDAGRLVVGQVARITPLGFAPLSTTVRSVLPAATADMTTVRVLLPLPAAPSPPVLVDATAPVSPDTPEAPLPTAIPVGTPVLGELLVAEVPEAMVIPARAVLRASGATYVMLAGADGRVVRREIRLGLMTTDLVQVVDGLELGEFVITSALAELSEGDRVRFSQ
jgi:hypothetical protein